MEGTELLVQTAVNILNIIQPEILFIVILSYAVNTYVKGISVRFLIPTAISFILAVIFAEVKELKPVLTLWFVYAGQSTILYEVVKHWFRRKNGKKRKK